MRLSCDRQELSDALSLAGMVVSSRSTRPVLKNVRLDVATDALEVCATDLEVGIRVRCERIDADQAGVILLDAARAATILKELPADRVDIELHDGLVTLSAEGSRYTLVTDDPESYPEVPAFDAEEPVRIDRSQLEGLLKKTSFAAASEALRYALNGVLVELEGDRARFVATDGKRLALAERSLLHPLPEGRKIARVVSNKAVQLLMRIAAPEDEQLQLAFTENQIQAKSSRAVLSAQLVQGHFPPYEDVIPKGLDREVTFETQPFLAALRQAQVLTTKESFAVRFAFTYNRLTLSSRDPGKGDAKIDLPIAYEHDPLETAFNPRYLTDVCRVLEGQQFTLALKDATLPCVISEGEEFRYVVMPIDL